MNKKPIKILLIEDDKDDYILLKKILLKSKEKQYVLEWEASYEKGLTILNSNKFDIAFIDYQLGEVNGIEIIKKARLKGCSRPIILLTGLNESEIDIQALKAGADDYLSKGQITIELLDRAIRYAIERKKAENEREKLLREQIQRRELDKRKDEFIGIASHELKTPVTSIKVYAQTLGIRFKKANDHKSAELIDKMDSQLNRLTKLIADLLDVTKIQGGKLQFDLEVFNFNELVGEITEEMQRTTEKHTIIKELSSAIDIYGDKGRIGQVITNLLSNAIKYSPHADKIVISSSVDNNAIIFSVQDFGIGIPEEAQSKVFQRFYRSKNSGMETYPGLGLGLYISSEIINRHNGSFWLESKVGKGCTFSFSLPLTQK